MLMSVLNAIAPGHQFFARILHVSPKPYRTSGWPLTAEHAGLQGLRSGTTSSSALLASRAVRQQGEGLTYTKVGYATHGKRFIHKLRTSQLSFRNVYEEGKSMITGPRLTAPQLNATELKSSGPENIPYSLPLLSF